MDRRREDMDLIIISLGWYVIRQKKKKLKIQPPQVTVKTTVWVSVYMVEEKGIKTEKKNKIKNQTEMITTLKEMKRGK